MAGGCIVATPLKSAKDTIATTWEALTPPTDTGRGYHKLTGRTQLDGASGHRCFWFEPPAAGSIEGYAATMQHMRHAIAANVKLSTAGAGIDDLFDRVADEAVLLMGSINFYGSALPAGVDYMQANSYSAEPAESEDVILSIQIEVLTQETDG